MTMKMEREMRGNRKNQTSTSFSTPRLPSELGVFFSFFSPLLLIAVLLLRVFFCFSIMRLDVYGKRANKQTHQVA